MHRFAAASVRDLAPAAGAVCDQERVLARRAHRGEQIQLRHLHRQRVVLGLVAEGAGHAAAAGLDDLRLKPGNPIQDSRRGIEDAEGLLVAVAVDESRVRAPRLQIESGTHPFLIADEEFLQQQSAFSHIR